ncbi:hypothetical protein DPMN_095616 [Dreissena polymorpha]|uniref:Uncharacterized protein n=1 Tax=Dreissena polymorpha TaxID=45954 RepID=A0A9D4R3Q8_DREPO|nr:hypothetical protein DPMN_095616 [Dreissena polymorpha]
MNSATRKFVSPSRYEYISSYVEKKPVLHWAADGRWGRWRLLICDAVRKHNYVVLQANSLPHIHTAIQLVAGLIFGAQKGHGTKGPTFKQSGA